MRKLNDLRVRLSATDQDVEEIVTDAVNKATDINQGTFYGYEASYSKAGNVLVHYNDEDHDEHEDFVNRLINELVLTQIKMYIAQKLDLKANEFVIINKPTYEDNIYCTVPVYVLTPHAEISFGFLKIKRDFGIVSTIDVYNNYRHITSSNAHRIICG